MTPNLIGPGKVCPMESGSGGVKLQKRGGNGIPEVRQEHMNSILIFPVMGTSSASLLLDLGEKMSSVHSSSCLLESLPMA